MYYVYVLKEKDGTLYKGFTSDLKKRINEHNFGKIKSTKTLRPWKLIYYEAFVSKKDARREEIFLKTGRGRDRLKFLFKHVRRGAGAV